MNEKRSFARYSVLVLFGIALIFVVNFVTGQSQAQDQAQGEFSVSPQGRVTVPVDEMTSEGIDDVPDDFGPSGIYSTNNGPFPGTPLPMTDAPSVFMIPALNNEGPYYGEDTESGMTQPTVGTPQERFVPEAADPLDPEIDSEIDSESAP